VDNVRVGDVKVVFDVGGGEYASELYVREVK
jgi:hypothetical protein